MTTMNAKRDHEFEREQEGVCRRACKKEQDGE